MMRLKIQIEIIACCKDFLTIQTLIQVWLGGISSARQKDHQTGNGIASQFVNVLTTPLFGIKQCHMLFLSGGRKQGTTILVVVVVKDLVQEFPNCCAVVIVINTFSALLVVVGCTTAIFWQCQKCLQQVVYQGTGRATETSITWHC